MLGSAERAIRYFSIHGYTDMYKTLEQNLKQIGSVSDLRSKLESCKEGITETTQIFNVRFSQVLMKLNTRYSEDIQVLMKRKFQ